MLPNADAIKQSSEEGRAEDTALLEKYKLLLSAEILNKVKRQIYKFEYYTSEAPTDVVRRLRDWVNEYPGYRAHLDMYDDLIIKIPKDNQKPWKWPFYLRWIPGLGN